MFITKKLLLVSNFFSLNLSFCKKMGIGNNKVGYIWQFNFHIHSFLEHGKFIDGRFANVQLKSQYVKTLNKIKTRRGSHVDRKTSTAETLPIGKIQPFSKIALPLEPVMQFGCPSRFRISYKIVTLSIL